MNEGKLIIFSAPSGSGKTTIVKKLLQENLPLAFSISACSREKRKGEMHAKDYYFLEVDDFKQKIANNEFVEWEEVYPDHFYGTLKSEVERIWQNNQHVLFDVDVVGGLNIKKQYNDRALAIFVKPPSIKELEERLKNRSTDSAEKIEMRLEKATAELKFEQAFDTVIVNDKLEVAIQEVIREVKEFLSM